MTISDEATICNLLYRYAEVMDSGDFAATAELFRHARVVLDPANNVSVDADGLLKLWTDSVIRYPDGTPRTKHVTTNPIVEIDDETGTATCRSYYTVFQQTDTLPLQPIVAGRYHDRFEHAAGTWRFTERDYSLVDLVGDISQHLRLPVGQGGDDGIECQRVGSRPDSPPRRTRHRTATRPVRARHGRAGMGSARGNHVRRCNR